MKLNWSHKLFLRINKGVGERPIVDNFMRFCANWLILFLVLFTMLWVMFNFDRAEVWRRLFVIGIVVLVNYIISVFIGLIARRPRPKAELPETKQLIQPICLWKSFPSDHAAISFLIVFLLLIYGASIYFGIIMILMACFVAISRVYVGVHYPRDILGGFALACILSLIFLYFGF